MRQPSPWHGLSVVIPAHNEADNLAGLIIEIGAVLGGVRDAQGRHVGHEIVVVDDGSDDATPDVLANAMTNTPALRVLRHACAHGQSRAVTSGVRAARYAWIVTLDGDGQNDPADIPTLLAAFVRPDTPRELALVAGWRVRRDDSWIKRVSSRVANRVRSRVLGDATPDSGCGLKLFSREVFLRLPNFDHMHRFLPALVRREGGAVVSVPVGHRPRTRGASHYGVGNRLWVGLVDMLGVCWLQRRMRGAGQVFVGDVGFDDAAQGAGDRHRADGFTGDAGAAESAHPASAQREARTDVAATFSTLTTDLANGAACDKSAAANGALEREPTPDDADVSGSDMQWATAKLATTNLATENLATENVNPPSTPGAPSR